MTKVKWFNCSEVMPENCTKVLLTIEIDKEVRDVISAYYVYHLSALFVDFGPKLEYKPIAWTPMPKPYME